MTTDNGVVEDPQKAKANELSWIIIIIACVVVFASIHFLGKNNPVELAAEDIIQVETGNDKMTNLISKYTPE